MIKVPIKLSNEWIKEKLLLLAVYSSSNHSGWALCLISETSTTIEML